LEALSGPLRRWASSRLAEAFIAATRVYVELEEGYCGVALTPRWLPLRPLEPADLAPWKSTPRSLARLPQRRRTGLAAAAAVAAVNAATAAWMLETAGEPHASGIEILVGAASLAERLGIGPGDRVMMLGYMPGLAADISRRAAELVAADYEGELLAEARRRGHKALDARSREEVVKAIGRATAVVFSGSAVLDPPTFLAEVEAARRSGARLVALVGATSSFHPLVALRLGVDAVAGTLVEPSLCPRVRSTVAAGGGVHRVRGRLLHWLWRRS